MNFAQAIEALNEGKMIQREGWNGKGLFVFKQVPSRIDKEFVPKMQSLPQLVKDEFELRFAKNAVQSISYDNQLAMVSPLNSITGWSPSVSDILANDWVIFR